MQPRGEEIVARVNRSSRAHVDLPLGTDVEQPGANSYSERKPSEDERGRVPEHVGNVREAPESPIEHVVVGEDWIVSEDDKENPAEEEPHQCSKGRFLHCGENSPLAEKGDFQATIPPIKSPILSRDIVSAGPTPINLPSYITPIWSDS